MKRALYSLTLILALLATSIPSHAQKNNWFLGVGLGGNLVYDNAKISPAAPAAQLYIGDWFAPAFGFRAVLHGILANPADPQETWFSSDTVFGLFQLHADGLWNFMNTFQSYKPNRVWNPALYMRVSGILASSLGSHKGSVGIGGGWMNQFRVTDFMSVALDLNAILTSEKTFRTDRSGRFAILGSATIGVVFDLGFRGFED